MPDRVLTTLKSDRVVPDVDLVEGRTASAPLTSDRAMHYHNGKVFIHGAKTETYEAGPGERVFVRTRIIDGVPVTEVVVRTRA